MGNTVDLKLGHKSYLVRELAIRPNRAWREKAQPIMDFVNQAVSTLREDATDGEIVKTLTSKLINLLVDRIDEIIDLVFAYSEQLEAERETIETTATETQMLEAFIQIMGVAYPIGFLAKKATEMYKVGSALQQTLTNSAAQNGVSGETT